MLISSTEERAASQADKNQSLRQADFQRSRALAIGPTLPSQGEGQEQAALPVDLSWVSLWLG